MLAEELAEVQQIVGKILRHGRYSVYPEGGPTNKEYLESELGDVQAILRLMRCAGEVDTVKVQVACKDKLDRLQKYTHHQPKDLFIAAKNNL